ncbi:MAG: ABC transporter ATP-binding protein [Anaerolineae bacterium]
MAIAQVIQTTELTRRFGDLTAVDKISFSVEQGEVFGLLGPNGAGKTTLVRLLNGVLPATSGSARVLNYDPDHQGDDLRKHTGVLTESTSLYEQLTARANLQFFGTLYGLSGAELDRRTDEALKLFGLTERAENKAGEFSKGMKQRLALARTLVHQPDLLFFDEPTAALDPEATHQVTELIARLSRESGRTIFLCTHNLDEAQRLCNRVAVINKGCLLAIGAPAQLARDLFQGFWVDIELQAAPPGDLAANLGKLTGVEKVTLDKLKLAVQIHSEEMIPAVVTKLVELTAQIVRVNPRVYSLEDIYFEIQKGGRS